MAHATATALTSGMVHALGPESESASKLYGHLTGRGSRTCRSIDEVTISTSDVVICVTARLTPALMHKLYVHDRPHGVPGLICAATATDLEEVCLKQAALIASPKSQVRRRIFLFPSANFQSMNRGDDLIIGGSESHDKIIAELSTGAAILTVVGGHSDGIDFNLSLGQFACPFLDWKPASLDLMPPCQVEGKCTRFPAMPPIAAALKAGWIVPLSVLKADIGLIFGCNIVRLLDGVLDPACGLAATLLRQAHFRVLITTWRKEFAFPDGRHLHALLNDLSSGAPVGEAVCTFNNSSIAKYMGINLCVIGDPRFALSGATSYPQLPHLPIESQPSPSPVVQTDPTMIQAAQFLRAATLKAMNTMSTLDLKKGTQLLTALDAIIERGQYHAEANSVTWMLLEFLSGAPWLDAFLGSLSRVENITEDAICPSCFAPARKLLMTFPRHAVKARQVIRCARCSDSSNLPLGWTATLDLRRLQDGLLSVAGIPEEAQLLVCFMTWHGPLFAHFRCSADGTGHTSFQLPDTLPKTPIICKILIGHRLNVGSLGFRLRRLSNDVIATSCCMANPDKSVS